MKCSQCKEKIDNKKGHYDLYRWEHIYVKGHVRAGGDRAEFCSMHCLVAWIAEQFELVGRLSE